MSATINANDFANYYVHCADVINVSGRTFPVDSYYVEDVVEMTNYVLEESSEYSAKRGQHRSM